jgi:hypothetical protein
MNTDVKKGKAGKSEHSPGRTGIFMGTDLRKLCVYVYLMFIKIMCA